MRRSVSLDPSQAASPLRVGLMWHSLDSGNLGLQALTFANIGLIDEVAERLGLEVVYTIFAAGKAPPLDSRIVRLTSAEIILPWRLWRRLRHVDCVMDIGEGDGFSDIYGVKRFARQGLTKVVTRLAGAPLMLCPQTVGPFSNRVARLAAKLLLGVADEIVVRDDRSSEEVLLLTGGRTPVKAIDAALAAPRPAERRRGSAIKNVAVNVSGLLYTRRGDLDYSTVGRDYIAFVDRLLEKLAARDDCRVHLFSHVTGEPGDTDDDGGVADALAGVHPGAVRVPDFRSPTEVQQFIAGMDLLVSSRLHACIAAYTVGTPVVPIAYSEKFSGLFDTLKYPWYAPSSGWEADRAVNLVFRAIDDLTALRHAMADGRAIVDMRLDTYRAALQQFLAKAVERRTRSGREHP